MHGQRVNHEGLLFLRCAVTQALHEHEHCERLLVLQTRVDRHSHVVDEDRDAGHAVRVEGRGLLGRVEAQQVRLGDLVARLRQLLEHTPHLEGEFKAELRNLILVGALVALQLRDALQLIFL